MASKGTQASRPSPSPSAPAADKAAVATPLLRLPPELHLLIAEHLSLASRLVFQRYVCTQLWPSLGPKGSLDPVSDGLYRTSSHRSSVLVPRHRFSLAEARQAAEEILALRDQEQLSAVRPMSASLPVQEASLVAPPPGKMPSANSVFWETGPPLERPPAALHPLPPRRALCLSSARGAMSTNVEIPFNHNTVHEGPAMEARFAFKALEVLTGVAAHNEPSTSTGASPTQTHSVDPESAPLRTLSLIGLYGLPGALVLHLLRNHPALRSVSTLVKTERFDLGAWTSFTWQAHDTSPINDGSVEFYVPAGDWSGGHRIRAPSSSSHSFRSLSPPSTHQSHETDPAHAPAEHYVYTQALVRVGSNLARLGSASGVPTSIKGMGIQVGFECWCFVPPKICDNEAEDGSRIEDDRAPTSSERPSLGIPLRHIILQGRYTLPEALEAETMLAYSDVVCNACKENIEF